ncbi:MAG: hypothetical protein MJZ76_10410 [Bacteroidales bacterium]|nr:hypothetical protein [Bacteroidales bacterium]
MDFKKLDKLLASFYDGTISQTDLEELFNAFVCDSAVRNLRPDDAAVLLPLAMARKDHQTVHSRKASFLSRSRRVAAAIIIIISLSSIIAVLVFKQPTQIYTSGSDCNYSCAEQWLDRTIQTAL